MPRRFISRTTSSPNRVRPPCLPGVVRAVRPVERDVVGQGHVAHAEVVVGAQRAQRVLDGVAALHAQQRSATRPARIAPLHVGGGERPGQPRDSARSAAARCRSARAGRARSPRTSTRPGVYTDQNCAADAALLEPRAGRCRPASAPADVVGRRRRAGAFSFSRMAQGRSLWPSITGWAVSTRSARAMAGSSAALDATGSSRTKTAAARRIIRPPEGGYLITCRGPAPGSVRGTRPSHKRTVSLRPERDRLRA